MSRSDFHIELEHSSDRNAQLMFFNDSFSYTFLIKLAYIKVITWLLMQTYSAVNICFCPYHVMLLVNNFWSAKNVEVFHDILLNIS